MLSNGMGGIDWQQIEFAAAFYGLADLDALIHALLVIKTHVPPDKRRDEDDTETDLD